MHFFNLLFNEKLACLTENQQMLHNFYRVFLDKSKNVLPCKNNYFFEKKYFSVFFCKRIRNIWSGYDGVFG